MFALSTQFLTASPTPVLTILTLFSKIFFDNLQNILREGLANWAFRDFKVNFWCRELLSHQYDWLKALKRFRAIWTREHQLALAVLMLCFHFRYEIRSQSIYRTRANKWRSRLGAAPLRFHAKSDFLCHLYVIIMGVKKQFLNTSCAIYWRGYGILEISNVPPYFI